MNLIDWTALLVVFVGALNWGLVGVAHFVDASANWNLVNALFAGVPELEFGVYVLVGLASLWTAYLATRLAGVEIEDIAGDEDIAPESETPGGSTK